MSVVTTVDMLAIGIEKLELKHKRERKDLQANIMQLKKAVPKGDKKRLKEMQVKVTQMEADFEKKCTDEIMQMQTQWRNTAEDSAALGPTEDGNFEDGDEKSIDCSDNSGARKVTKAEKRREKKRLMELERDRRIAEDEQANANRPRAIEDQLLREKLAQKKMHVHDIAPDGNCLFSAIAHQFLTRYGVTFSPIDIRRKCVAHLRRNRDDFEPFLEESVDFDEYCSKMETDQSCWGGNLELRAISEEMDALITVYQAHAPSLEFGEETPAEMSRKRCHLHLTYHHHLIWTGAHYNSAIDIRSGESDELSIAAKQGEKAEELSERN